MSKKKKAFFFYSPLHTWCLLLYLMTLLLLLMNEQRKSPDRLQLLTSAGERLDELIFSDKQKQKLYIPVRPRRKKKKKKNFPLKLSSSISHSHQSGFLCSAFLYKSRWDNTSLLPLGWTCSWSNFTLGALWEVFISGSGEGILLKVSLSEELISGTCVS